MRFQNLFSLLLVIIGFFAIINSEFVLTGAFVGANEATDLLSIIGFIAVFLGVLLFQSHSGLETIVVTENITDPGLIRKAEEALKNEKIKKESNKLINQYRSGILSLDWVHLDM